MFEREQSKLDKVRFWVSLVISSFADALPLVPSPHDGSQSSPDPAVQFSQLAQLDLFEVVVPSLQFRIELVDNSIHGASVVASGLFPDTVFEFIQTFRAAEPGYPPAPAASEKPVAEKVEAFLPATYRQSGFSPDAV